MIKAIVGANWGDEGKGKVTDVFAQQSDIVVRFQGGNNAGHTIINEYGKFALHMLPSGVFNPHITNVIGNGVALNVAGLMKEINQIKERGLNPNLMVSDRAQIVMSYHILFDTLEEARLANKQYGSTKSGIAPFYSDKYAKIGFQVCELFDDVWLDEKIDRILAQKNALLVHLYQKEPLTKQQIFDELHGYRDQIAPYVHDTITFLHKAYHDGKTILLEGQLGALRDPDFGIYPYSTSSHTLLTLVRSVPDFLIRSKKYGLSLKPTLPLSVPDRLWLRSSMMKRISCVSAAVMPENMAQRPDVLVGWAGSMSWLPALVVRFKEPPMSY
jgi:adenylosuccinate synthase